MLQVSVLRWAPETSSLPEGRKYGKPWFSSTQARAFCVAARWAGLPVQGYITAGRRRVSSMMTRWLPSTFPAAHC